MLCEAIRTHFTDQQLDFVTPTAGMFLWAQLSPEITHGQSSEQIFKSLAAAGVVTVYGDSFKVPNSVLPSGGSGKDEGGINIPLRLSFANASPTAMRAGALKIAECLLSPSKK